MDQSPDVGELVNAYVEIHNAREILNHKFEEEDGALKTDLTQIEAALLSICNALNVDSLKTDHGTAMRQLSERYYCKEWDTFKDFIRENDALDLFERRVHQTNLKTFLTEHESEGLPPGLEVQREFKIVVRRASK